VATETCGSTSASTQPDYQLTTNYIGYPSRAEDKPFFLADPPHLLKSVRNCLLTQNIILPHSLVTHEQLPSNIVSLDHVRTLNKLQSSVYGKVLAWHHGEFLLF